MSGHNLFSERIKERMASPLCRYTGKESSDHTFQFSLDLSGEAIPIDIFLSHQGSGHIERLYHKTTLKGLPLAFLDVLCELSWGKTRPKLLELTEREIENYLRDQNDKEAYPPLEFDGKPLMGLLDRVIYEVEHKLAQSLQKGGERRRESYESSSLVEKITETERMLDHYIRPLLRQDSGDVELVYIEGKTIFISYMGVCGHCPASQRGTLRFINETLVQTWNYPSLQVKISS